MTSRNCRRIVAAVVAVTLALLTSDSSAQQFRRGGRFGRLKLASEASFDGSFNFCRIMFGTGRYGDGGGWGVDYPRADVNLSIRLSELTKTTVSFDEAGEPNHLVLQLTDAALFRCPFVMMTEVGAAYLDDDEAVSLRNYLLKGGFLWADDFWGSYAWDAWVDQISKVLPPSEYAIVDLPADHVIFRTMFNVRSVPQIASINFWAGSGGQTSERGADSAEAHMRAITDKRGRVMVLMTHNTDVGDSWEREGDDPTYFQRFSVDGYALAINIVLYAMTH